MFSSTSAMRFITALCAFSCIAQVSAMPALISMPQSVARQSTASSYWLANVKHQGSVWGQNDSSYQVFRDVTDPQFAQGADPSGVKDSSLAIQAAIDAGGRCGFGCNSSTVTPAIIYIPPGKYLIGQPINMDYYTQIIGDGVNRPTILAASNFSGMALFDSDPYTYVESLGTAVNWYVNQNNFFRQMRNLIFDFTTDDAPDTATAIHWQVAQATSLQNIDFLMKPNSGQQGIFMDNGSGGWFSDLFFSGGKVGAFVGSQQFTSRNLRFEGVTTAIFMNWNWGWTLSNISISNSVTGVDMSSSPKNQTVGSMILSDSIITGTTYGIMSAYDGNNGQNTPVSGGSLVIDNVDMTGATHAVYQNGTLGGKEIVAGGQKITSWVQGNIYDHTATQKTQVGFTPNITKNEDLLLNGNIFGQSKPQYIGMPASNFTSAKSYGCKGDGETDDTQCVQAFLNSAAKANNVAFFDHGAYIVSDTIVVPNQIAIVGEIWPLIVALGTGFNDATNPKPVFQVGSPSDTSSGHVEISDMLFSIKGPAPGAIMIEWNINSALRNSGIWDSHIRIGGSYGSELQTEQCLGNPTVQSSTTDCLGVFLMFHATRSSSAVYLENVWMWVADHDMDNQNQTQISIYSGRGALFQSGGPTWLWGTAVEHSVIYNYQIDGVSSFFGGFMQTETPYFQPDPLVPNPLAYNHSFHDPTFTICTGADATSTTSPCRDAWGMRILESRNVLIYAVGMYSFFNNYEQTCVAAGNCQENMIRIQGSQVDMYTVTTIATVNMIRDDRLPNQPILAADNTDVYGDTLAYYGTG